MLIWRGYGILVAILTIVAYVVAAAVAEHAWGTPLTPDHRGVVGLGGMLLAAALVYGLHLALARTSQPRVVIDKATGREITLVAKHDFFFIPVRFWAIILVALGVMFFFRH